MTAIICKRRRQVVHCTVGEEPVAPGVYLVRFGAEVDDGDAIVVRMVRVAPLRGAPEYHEVAGILAAARRISAGKTLALMYIPTRGPISFAGDHSLLPDLYPALDSWPSLVPTPSHLREPYDRRRVTAREQHKADAAAEVARRRYEYAALEDVADRAMAD